MTSEPLLTTPFAVQDSSVGSAATAQGCPDRAIGAEKQKDAVGEEGKQTPAETKNPKEKSDEDKGKEVTP